MDNPGDALDDFYAFCPHGFFTATRDGAVLRLSAHIARLLGPVVQGKTPLAELVHPGDRRAFDAAWARIDESCSPLPFHLQLKGADGAYRLVSCRARWSPASGDVLGVVRVVRVVRVEQESAPARDAAATRNEEDAMILRLFQDHLPITVWAIDRQGIFTHHEGKGLAAAHGNPAELVGKNVFELYAGNEQDLAMIRKAGAGEIVHSFSTDHDASWENWTVPVRDEQGDVSGVAGMTIDLSEAKRAESELRARLAQIERQQQVMRELSTPIIEVWDKVLTLPLVGVVDSRRAGEVMQRLLVEIGEKGARFAILDLTGVDEVDTSTASHLLELIQAIRLLGAESIITGIQPAVARTMVVLGVDMNQVVTLATLCAGLRYCIQRMSSSAAPTEMH